MRNELLDISFFGIVLISHPIPTRLRLVSWTEFNKWMKRQMRKFMKISQMTIN